MIRRHSVIRSTIAPIALAAGMMLTGGLSLAAQSGNPPPKTTFNDQDRKVTRDWFDANKLHLPEGLKDTDKLPPPIEDQLKPGLVIDPKMKELIRPVPTDLLHMLAPPPGVYKYAIVGWHLVLIDESNRVTDVIHIGHIR